VALAIGATFMSAIAAGMAMMGNQRRMVDQATSTSMMADEIKMATMRPDNCTANLANGSNSIDENGPKPISIAGYMANRDMGKGLKVKSVNIVVDKNLKTTANPVGMPGVIYDRYPAVIQLQTTLATSSGNFDSRVRTIPIMVNADQATHRIMGCQLDSGDQQVCSETGGVWDESAPIGQQCIPVDHCETAGSFTFLSNAEGGFNNYRTGGKSCPDGYKLHRTGAMSVARKDGKYGVKNTTYPIYTCARCPNGAGDSYQTATRSFLDNDGFDDLNSYTEEYGADNGIADQQQAQLDYLQGIINGLGSLGF
jgi:hypothetical protein